MNNMFDKIIIIGLGLMGSSIAKSCKKNKISNQILASSKDREVLNFALKNNIIDGIYDFDHKISDDDLVIIATPLSAYEEVLYDIIPNIGQKTIITDVGSVKSFIESNLLPKFNILKSNFVSCHPIAGSDKSGIENSIDDLFFDKKLIIIKNDEVSSDKIKKIALFWKKIGSKIQYLTASKHDKIYALTSHLLQKISFLFYFKNQYDIKDDLTQKHLRLQNSNTDIWKDIFLLNKENISYDFSIFEENLDILISFLKHNKYQEIIFNFHQIDFSFVEAKEIVNHEQDIILTRIILTSCCLLISDIDDYKDYFGSGFEDFTKIMSYLKYLLSNEELLIELLVKNKRYILDNLAKRSPIKFNSN